MPWTNRKTSKEIAHQLFMYGLKFSCSCKIQVCSCNYCQYLLRYLVTACSVCRSVLSMTKGLSIAPTAGYRLLLTFKHQKCRRQCMASPVFTWQPCHHLPFPQPVSNDCLNRLHTMLTVQDLSLLVFAMCFDGHTAPWFCSTIWLEPPDSSRRKSMV